MRLFYQDSEAFFRIGKNNKFSTVSTYNGRVNMHLRQFQKDGSRLTPTIKGITVQPNEFEQLIAHSKQALTVAKSMGKKITEKPAAAAGAITKRTTTASFFSQEEKNHTKRRRRGR